MLRLRFSVRARDSLASYDDYLRPKNPGTADALLAEVERLCILIADFPRLGHAIPGTSLRCHITRKYRYRVVYRVVGDTVQILDVLHPRSGRTGAEDVD